MSHLKRIKAGLLGASAVHASIILAQIGLVPIMIHAWGVEGYGLWLTVSSLASVLTYTNLGFPGVLRTAVARALVVDRRSDIAGSLLGSLLVLLAVAIALCSGILLWFSKFEPISAALRASTLGRRLELTLVLLLVQYSTAAAYTVFGSVVGGFGKYGKVDMLEAFRSMTETASIVGIVTLAPQRMYLLPCASLVLYLIACAILATRIRHLCGPIVTRETIRSISVMPLLRAVGPVSASLFSYNFMINQLPRIVIGSAMGPSALALYSVTSMVFRVPRMGIALPSHSVTVELASFWAKGSVEPLKRILSIVLAITAAIALVSTATLVPLSGFVIRILSHHQLDGSLPITVLCGLAAICVAVSQPSQEALLAMGAPGRASRRMIFFTPFLAGVAIWAARFGVLGVAGTIVAIEAAYALLTWRSVSGMLALNYTDALNAACKDGLRQLSAAAASIRTSTS